MNTIETENEKAIIDKHNRILSTISHDLKSPMIAILGFSRILMREIKADNPDHKWLNMLDIIMDSGKGMLGLIEDILSMAKMEAGKEIIEFELIEDISKELHEIEHTFGCEAKAKGINLSVVIKSHLPVVRWDMKRLRYHALNNLVSNALKFTPSGGRIVISAEAFDKTVMLKVADTGPGIPEEVRDKIFRRFGHTELCSERTKKGDGLGLYNARLFVTQHGGKIWLDDLVNQGAVFLITLPVDPTQDKTYIEVNKNKTNNRHKLLL
ncbi:MAG: sensor histidine kinase [Candidatus Scalindua sp.]